MVKPVAWCCVYLLPLLIGSCAPTGQEPPKAEDKNNVLEEFDFSPRDGWILVPVSLDGRKHQFLFTTGGQLSTLDESFRNSLGPSVRDINTADGSRAPIFRWPKAKIGMMELTGDKEYVYCYDLFAIRQWTGLEISGSLGLDWLWLRGPLVRDRGILQVDFDEGKLRFLASVSAKLGELLPLRGVPKKLEVAARLPVLGEVWFWVDLGWDRTGTLPPEECSKMRREEFARKVGEERIQLPEKGVENFDVSQVQSVSLGSFQHEGLVFHEAPGLIPRRLGLGFWSRYLVTFDFVRQTVYLKKGRRFSEPDTWDRSGLSLVREGGQTLVYSVATASPAWAERLQPGDEIISVAGKPAADYTLAELRKVFCSAGIKVPLKVKMEGDSRDVSLALPH